MKNDKQLGQEQRYVIDRLLRQGKSQKEIARSILTSAKQVSQVEKMINERPVRKFNYQTPNPVFLQKLTVAVVT
jgi:IS30 family transposase